MNDIATIDILIDLGFTEQEIRELISMINKENSDDYIRLWRRLLPWQ
jgi:Holliday junction resolvasome RuvABC DNA-binding subunit